MKALEVAKTLNDLNVAGVNLQSMLSTFHSVSPKAVNTIGCFEAGKDLYLTNVLGVINLLLDDADENILYQKKNGFGDTVICVAKRIGVANVLQR